MSLLFPSLRDRFPGTRDRIYLDTAARGLLSRAVRAAVDRHLDEYVREGGDKPALFATVERMRARYAALIGADPEEVAITKNVSEGLNAIATALPWQPGDNVVLCASLEHPNNVYPWRNLARLRGIELRSVPERDGHIPVDALAASVDARTRAVAVSTVTFAPGFRTELAELGRVCREREALLLADGAQSVGVLHTDVEALGVDALAASTQKGLLGLYGLGLLYCRREWAERLHPAYLARFGVDLGQSHEAATGGEDWRLMPGARRFDLGNYNFVAAVALDESLRLLEELGTRAIDTHVTALATRLAAGLIDAGLPVVGGHPGPHLGSIVCVGRLGHGGHDATDDPAIASLHRALTDAGVRLSVRRGVLRLSLHLYTTAGDVDRVVELGRRWRSRHRLSIA